MSLYVEHAFTRRDWDNLLKSIRYTHPEFVPSPEQLYDADKGINAGQYASAPVVGSYVFPLNVEITPGVAKEFDISAFPEIAIRPKRFVANVPESQLVILESVTLAEVPMFVAGNRHVDAYMFNHLVVGGTLDLPTLTQETKVRIKGKYSGKLPNSSPMPNLLVFAFMGPALIEKIEIFWKDPERHYSCDVLNCESHAELPLTGPGPENWIAVRLAKDADDEGDFGHDDPQEGLTYICPNHGWMPDT